MSSWSYNNITLLQYYSTNRLHEPQDILLERRAACRDHDLEVEVLAEVAAHLVGAGGKAEAAAGVVRIMLNASKDHCGNIRRQFSLDARHCNTKLRHKTQAAAAAGVGSEHGRG